MRRTILLAGVAVLVFGVPGPALGAWGGEPDGNRHPMVGAIYVDINGDGAITWDEMFCSGSYAGPSADSSYDVFLTAGHCLAWVASQGYGTVYVSFDPDPRGTGLTAEELIATSNFAWDERFVPHEGAGGYRYDSGVLLLPARSVKGIKPVQLPPLGYLDTLNAAGTLRGMLFEIVGYGIVPLCWGTVDPPTPCAPPAWSYVIDGVRRTSEAPVKTLTEAFLWFNQNTSATGYGGLCYGDSGSPQFLPGTSMIVSTTSDFDTACRANSFNYRLDTSEAREFLGRYLTLP